MELAIVNLKYPSYWERGEELLGDDAMYIGF